jgi:hypothetical protein
MTGGQHGEKLCWRIDFKGPIPVEKGLRAAVALGKLCGRPARQEGKMAVIRPEWAIANPLAPGPDAYAPRSWTRTPHRPGSPRKTRRVASHSCVAKLATAVSPMRVPPETWMR